MTLGISIECHYGKCHYAERHIFLVLWQVLLCLVMYFCIVMLNVVLLSTIMLLVEFSYCYVQSC
jgi:hypothetical protein